MKKLLAILLGLALAAVAAEAKTYYVDASRPNNNGNGLKPATAKRTIQAAVNIAQNGDTILVYPGWYSPIATSKRITVKSVKGASKTGITGSSSSIGRTLADLGKNTALTGFVLDGRNVRFSEAGVSGGFLTACCLQRIIGSFTGEPIIRDAALTGCMIRRNRDGYMHDSVFTRCKIMDNHGSKFCIWKSRLCNCLVAGNTGWGQVSPSGFSSPSLFGETVFVNCTLAKNGTWHEAGEKPLSSWKSKFYNCILRNNYSRTQTWVSADRYAYGRPVLHNVDAAKRFENTYFRTSVNNRDPKFSNYAKDDYRLTKNSPCIDLGQLNATLKKLVGSCDLSGKNRIRGKAIDLGCYEY